MGAAYARRFASEGARLGLLDVDIEAARTVATELERLGVDSLPVACDVTDEGACRAALGAVSDRFGGVDVLINNAGISHRSAFATTDVAVLRRVMDVNFFGSVHCTKAALPSLLQRQGLIVAVSSIAGFAPLYGRTGYAASKHACEGLFASLRAELRGTGVDVMIVCPGFTATGIATAALDGDGRVTRHPQSTVGKQATPESVAEAVVRGAMRGKRRLVLTAVGKTTLVLTRFAPSLYEALMARSLRSELQRGDDGAADGMT